MRVYFERKSPANIDLGRIVGLRYLYCAQKIKKMYNFSMYFCHPIDYN